MIDETETIRRARVAELADTHRAQLEEAYGQVYTLEELQKEYDIIGFAAPLVVVINKITAEKGSFEFTHLPRYYFN